MADSAENLAARGFDGGGAIALHVFAEGVIGGHEEPGLRPLPNESLAEPGSERVSVIGPVNEISRTFRAFSRCARGGRFRRVRETARSREEARA